MPPAGRRPVRRRPRFPRLTGRRRIRSIVASFPDPGPTPLTASPATLRSQPPVAAIRLGASDRTAGETRFGRMLVWFMRLLSLLWVVQGLAQWTAVLTADGQGAGALDTMTSLGVGATVFFCAMDLIAAVGLWLAAPWGGVVWLVAVAAQWLSIIVLPRFFDHDVAVGVGGLVLVVLYFGLTYGAARENEPYV